MLIIQDKLISQDLVEQKFHCDLNTCKGACCTEGDYGAPVTEQEMETINNFMPDIAQNLPNKSVDKIKADGSFTFYKKPKIWGTTCHDDGACVFLTVNDLGISICGIEKTWYEKKITFQKPISCHLYPVRVTKNDIVGFEAWNYDQWDICSAACEKGKKEKIPVYQFVKDAIVRQEGQSFYDELHAAAQHLNEK